jgi:hypothetical protein
VSLLSFLGNGSAKTLPRQLIYATIEELLDASFSMLSVPYLRIKGESVGVSVFPPMVARWQLGKHVTAATNIRNDRRIVERIIFYAVRDLLKD